MKVTFRINPRTQFYAAKAVNDLPTDESMVVIIQRYTKKRTTGQNNYQWGAILGDISRQVEVMGLHYSPAIWHEHMKELFLPENTSSDLVVPGYVKWQMMPSGKLKMVGSTTKLTTKGMSIYFEEIYAYAVTELNVRFTANE